MNLVEPIEILNQRLIDHFGIDTSTGQPNWRIVFSEDQFEKRLTKHTKEGFELLTPEMVELPKYKQWIHAKFILEKLVIVPTPNSDELTTKMSYEPCWVYEDSHGNYLPPKWEATQLIVDTVHKQLNASKGLKYKDPESHLEGSLEEKEKRIQELEEALYGNESDMGDALATGNAVGYGVKK